jgi:hypothetical protein
MVGIPKTFTDYVVCTFDIYISNVKEKKPNSKPTTTSKSITFENNNLLLLEEINLYKPNIHYNYWVFIFIIFSKRSSNLMSEQTIDLKKRR